MSESLEELRKLGYWASAFPEGDGITFSKDEYSSQQALADFALHGQRGQQPYRQLAGGTGCLRGQNVHVQGGLDVATMDRQRVQMLQAVYWEMNQITWNVETLEDTEIVAVEQADGSFTEQAITAYERVLHLSITARTAEQQAALYAFNAEQHELMEELL